MNFNWLFKILIGILTVSIFTIVFMSMWNMITPLNTSAMSNFNPFPNFSIEGLESAGETVTACDVQVVSCDIDLGCSTCSSRDYECRQPEEGELSIQIPGTSVTVDIPGVDKEETPNLGYCVPKNNNPNQFCNTYTGQWQWIPGVTEDDGEWKCVCRYPNLFDGGDGGCIQPTACNFTASQIQTAENNLGITKDGLAYLQETYPGTYDDAKVGDLWDPTIDASTDEQWRILLLMINPYTTVPQIVDDKNIYEEIPLFACNCYNVGNFPSARLAGDPYNCYVDPCYFVLGQPGNGCNLADPEQNWATIAANKEQVVCTAACNCSADTENGKGGYNIPMYTLGVLEGYNMWVSKGWTKPDDLLRKVSDTRPIYPTQYYGGAYDGSLTESGEEFIQEMIDFGVVRNAAGGLCISSDYCMSSVKYDHDASLNPTNVTDQLQYNWYGLGQCNCGPLTSANTGKLILRDCYSNFNKNKEGDITINGQLDSTTNEPLYVLMEPCSDPYNPTGVECYQPENAINCTHGGRAVVIAPRQDNTGPFVYDNSNSSTETVQGYQDNVEQNGLWFSTGFIGTWCNCSTENLQDDGEENPYGTDGAQVRWATNLSSNSSYDDDSFKQRIVAAASLTSTAFQCTDALFQSWPPENMDVLDATSATKDEVGWPSPNKVSCYWAQNPKYFEEVIYDDETRNSGEYRVNSYGTEILLSPYITASYTQPNLGGRCDTVIYPLNFNAKALLPNAVLQQPIYWGNDGPLEENLIQTPNVGTYYTDIADDEEVNGIDGLPKTLSATSSKSLKVGNKRSKRKTDGQTTVRSNAGPFYQSGWCAASTGSKQNNDDVGVEGKGAQYRNYQEWKNMLGVGACKINVSDKNGDSIGEQVGCTGIRTKYQPGIEATSNASCINNGNKCDCRYCTGYWNTTYLPNSNIGTNNENKDVGNCQNAVSQGIRSGDKCSG